MVKMVRKHRIFIPINLQFNIPIISKYFFRYNFFCGFMYVELMYFVDVKFVEVIKKLMVG